MVLTKDRGSSDQTSVERIASVIDNWPLASSLCQSIRSGLATPFIHLDGSDTVEGVFQASLKAAIRNIEDHPRGELFRRLIEFGPHNPDESECLRTIFFRRRHASPVLFLVRNRIVNVEKTVRFGLQCFTEGRWLAHEQAEMPSSEVTLPGSFVATHSPGLPVERR